MKNTKDRINRYRKAYPDDKRADDEILAILRMQKKDKKCVDWLVGELIQEHNK